MVKDFENLVVWKKARELNKALYPITRRGEMRFDTRFVQQIRAAAGSVMDNIAEGYERNGNKEFINFLFIAKGSCGEFRSQIVRAFDAEYLTKEEYDYFYSESRKLSAFIMKLIQDIKNSDMQGPKYKTPL